mmetsp:Transcript_54406/g.90431  ORF Transcript_54406/g.90431 Transcript_54406/m.90431 type:complete len:552 (-) Transcript_54406:6-1661(-)
MSHDASESDSSPEDVESVDENVPRLSQGSSSIDSLSSIVPVSDPLQHVYKHIEKQSKLIWAQKEGEEVKAKRRSSLENKTKRAKEMRRIPSVSEGYGEMTRGSLDRLLGLLKGLPEAYKLSSESSFLDIGSGFGKVVFHMKLAGRVMKSEGIEFVRVRASVAEATRQMFADMIDLDGVSFICADATRRPPFPHSHLYMYDVIFNEDTYAALVPKLERSPFHVLISYRPQEFLQRRGLVHIDKIAQLVMRSTGKQTFTAHVYRKVEVTRRNFLASLPPDQRLPERLTYQSFKKSEQDRIDAEITEEREDAIIWWRRKLIGHKGSIKPAVAMVSETPMSPTAENSQQRTRVHADVILRRARHRSRLRLKFEGALPILQQPKPSKLPLQLVPRPRGRPPSVNKKKPVGFSSVDPDGIRTRSAERRAARRRPRDPKFILIEDDDDDFLSESESSSSEDSGEESYTEGSERRSRMRRRRRSAPSSRKRKRPPLHQKPLRNGQAHESSSTRLLKKHRSMFDVLWTSSWRTFESALGQFEILIQQQEARARLFLDSIL